MGVCLICLIFLVVKLLTGFEAFGPPVKDIALGDSVVILDGASVVRYLKVYGLALFSEKSTNDIFIMIRNIHFLCC